MFEFETLRFEAERFVWDWNKNNNLVGVDDAGNHKFTWQPHGAQFTIVEHIPQNRTAFQIKLPETLSRDFALKALGFDASWVNILK